MHPTQSDTQHISIHRHCMQHLLHDALLVLQHEQDLCQGLLAGDGNMIKKNLAVTKNSPPPLHAIDNFLDNCLPAGSNTDPITGIYLSTDASCPINPDRVQSLIEYAQKHLGFPPDCYLLLELSNKGRVDARLFADASFTIPITLNMQEDGNGAVTNG